MKEYIAAGVSKEDFLRRAQTALSSTPPGHEAASTADQTLQQSEGDGDGAPASENTQNARIQAMLAERARRLEADKKAKEAAAKKEAEARAKARKEADGSAQPSSSNANIDPAERKYAEELRHRKQQAAEERRRILKRIEDDRRERKEREAQERQARLLAQTQAQDSGGSGGGGGGKIHTSDLAPRPSSERTGASGSTSSNQQHQTCHLQVRLLTGTSIRGRFAATATLAADVRPWVDAQAASHDASGEANNGGAYTFRVVLTPQPNRAVSGPEAYARSGNPVSRLLGYALRFLAALWAFLVGLLLGGGGGGRTRQQEGEGRGETDAPADEAASPAAAAAAAGKSTGARIRGFEDDAEKRRRDSQLYNGNSVSFSLSLYIYIPAMLYTGVTQIE